MSVEFFLVCHDCKTKIHIGQDGLSGFTYYSGEAGCQASLKEFFADHAIGGTEHKLGLAMEGGEADETYESLWE